MSYAPRSLLDAQDYLAARTGLPLVAFGIVGDSAHEYGYHLGQDRLPVGDYSRTTARDRAGLSNAASALDIGSFPRLRELTAHLVARARAGGLPDVRELIGPHSDGRAYRWDHLAGWSASRRARNDSHEWHLHISFYRDSEHRSKLDMFRAFFQPEEEDMALTDEEIERIAKRSAELSATAVAKRPNPTTGIALGTAVRMAHARTKLLPDMAAELATVRGQLASLEELVGGLAAAEELELTDEQVAQLAAAVTQAGQGAAAEVLERLAAAGEALAEDES